MVIVFEFINLLTLLEACVHCYGSKNMFATPNGLCMWENFCWEASNLVLHYDCFICQTDCNPKSIQFNPYQTWNDSSQIDDAQSILYSIWQSHNYIFISIPLCHINKYTCAQLVCLVVANGIRFAEAQKNVN